MTHFFYIYWSLFSRHNNVTIPKDSPPINPRESYPGPQQQHQGLPPLGNNFQPANRSSYSHAPQSSQPYPRGGFSHQRGNRGAAQALRHAPFNLQSPQRPRPQNSSQNGPPSPRIHRNHQQGPQHVRQTSNQPVARDLANLGVKVDAPRILQRPQPLQGSSGKAPVSVESTQKQTVQQNQHLLVETFTAQCQYLDNIAAAEIPKVEISTTELSAKESFRLRLEVLCQDAIKEGYAGNMTSVALKCFGSLSSGFATQGSDVDLAVVPSGHFSSALLTHASQTDMDIPRLLEKKLLDNKLGARLLTRTRIPILKVCENPTEELYLALREERQKWDDLPEEEKYPPPQPTPPPAPLATVGQNGPAQIPQNHGSIDQAQHESKKRGKESPDRKVVQLKPTKTIEPATPSSNSTGSQDDNNNDNKTSRQNRFEKPWLREKILGPLDFPKSGVGIQSDINFANPLALHNTDLLRCYCLCDPRVRPMVLFVKAWAKRRKINSSYSGTLSSYGYVLMVLHYLVNIAQPPVCPNLQLCWRPPVQVESLEKALEETSIDGYEVRFWRNENEIATAARQGRLTANRQSLGALLRGFFQFFANTSRYNSPGFNWTGEVLSLRTPGGIRTKGEKGWTGARTTVVDEKEIRHRFLFAIEDPFEWDHNVARTVTHNGIVAIRDEFRRAWRILVAVGQKRQPEGGLFEAVVEQVLPPTQKTAETETEGEKNYEKDIQATTIKVKGSVAMNASLVAKGSVETKGREEKPVGQTLAVLVDNTVEQHAAVG
ncbi:hypothetical protein K432DRAFT_376936 [Lepidopterella palustris CBS 459.81]|uniref:polynucleotide adenylyltransferase n=1 Tax=Lepidopterella palustris CBS 459.81 TaxID=1314670 RepID=A0A8E2JLE0_9PEZI|nr:hypothetical protein K432DRAFT_376936 [Lepidopterella palustris CBS 459.81]